MYSYVCGKELPLAPHAVNEFGLSTLYSILLNILKYQTLRWFITIVGLICNHDAMYTKSQHSSHEERRSSNGME